MKGRTLLDYGVVVVVAVILAVVVQALVVKPYRIPSESMAATLVPRDRVLVNRVVYHLREPRRGDVVVVDSTAVGRVLIKRVVGLPGDKLSLRDGALYINGRRLAEPYVVREGAAASATEAFYGTGQPWSLERAYRVPAGHYFLMGDNRPVSDDSRDWGPVARREIIGAAFLTYWPLNRLSAL